MSVFTVNGISYTVTENVRLMTFLRDSLRLTSVKNGCAEGACGTCTVLIDGRAQKACVQKTENLDGKSITTTEGLTDREKVVYSYAFSHAGAVQCGFCIPGMVICAKALLDKNPHPSRDDIKTAIKNNICRCTGYKKIEDAILMAAEIFRENSEINEPVSTGLLGESMARVDAAAKVTGEAKYADDYYMENMLAGSALRSEYPRARVLSIDTSEAEKLDGVVCIMTAADIPGTKKVGHLKRDWDVMVPVGGITHYLGDAIALIAAETAEILEQAKKLIKVEYEPLEGVFSPNEAMKDNAPLVHEDGNLLASEHLVRGNADEVIAKSRYKVTNHYSVPFTEHAFMEPECAVAYLEEGGIHIMSGDQGIYQTQR